MIMHARLSVPKEKIPRRWKFRLEGSHVYHEKEVIADDRASITAIRHYSELKQNRPWAMRKPPPLPTLRTSYQNSRRSTLPTWHGPLPPARRALPPQSGGPLLPREMEPRETTARIPYFCHERYSSVFFLLPIRHSLFSHC